MYIHTYSRAHMSQCACGSQKKLWGVVFFPYVDSVNGTQVIRFGGMCLY